jgi:trehalose/maltose transport system permease protein
MSRSIKRLLGRIGFYLLLAVIIFYTVFPFYWAIVSSLKSGSALFQVDFWPPTPAWDNYTAVFREQPFGRNILNSIFVAVSTVILSLTLAVLAAYALGRIQFRGRMPLLFTVLGVSMFPQIAVLSGMFVLIRALGLYNNLLSLTLSYLIFTLPFTGWVLTSFMRELPKELEEAAIIDGCSSWQVLIRIYVPAIRPAIVTVALFAFVTSWNEFLAALVLMNRGVTFTLPLILANARQETSIGGTDWGLLQAGITISIVPCILFYVLLQRYYVSGFLSGAVK